MRAMILAAGRGERMGEITARCPKPLLRVGDRYLIEYAISSLKRAGIFEMVINVSYLGEQIKQALGQGERYGVQIAYSEEAERLETGGGIVKALPLLGCEPFLVISSDIITDFPLQAWQRDDHSLAHLLVVDNPPYHPSGDFGLQGNKIDLNALPAFTFGNIGWYHPDLFVGMQPHHFRLTKVLMPAISDGRVTGELYRGSWFNIGTVEDLNAFHQRAREDSNL